MGRARTPESLDAPRQEEFSEVLAGVTPDTLGKLPDLTDRLDMRGRTSHGLMSKLVRELGGQQGLLATNTEDINLEHSGLNFTPQEMLRIGRDNSYNGVFFGSLEGLGGESDEKSKQVAVKPIYSDQLAQRNVLHEVAVTQYLSKIGLPTFQLEGVALYEGSQTATTGFMFTALDARVATYDSLRWARMHEEDKWDQVSKMAFGLAGLHSNLVFHGDSEFKNLAFTEGNEGPFYVDLEHASILTEKNQDIEALKRHMSNDLTCTAKSIGEFIFYYIPGVIQGQVRFDVLRKRLYEPYGNALEEHGSEHTLPLMDAYSRMLEMKEQHL